MVTRSGVITLPRVNPVIRTSAGGIESDCGLRRSGPVSSPTQLEEYLRPRSDVNGRAASSRMCRCANGGIPFPLWSEAAIESRTPCSTGSEDENNANAVSTEDLCSAWSEHDAKVDVNDEVTAKLAKDDSTSEESTFDPAADDDADDNAGSETSELKAAAAAAANCSELTGEELRSFCSEVEEEDEGEGVKDDGVAQSGDRSDIIPDVIVDDLDCTSSSEFV